MDRPTLIGYRDTSAVLIVLGGSMFKENEHGFMVIVDGVKAEIKSIHIFLHFDTKSALNREGQRNQYFRLQRTVQNVVNSVAPGTCCGLVMCYSHSIVLLLHDI